MTGLGWAVRGTEVKAISSWASTPEASRGRLHPEPGGTVRGPRDAFQRDRDRIIHSISFRRLRHKTQVFMAPDGDHFRVRLTHSLEVAQIGRAIARTLGLNEDLTEALCLAHDIGHPPFGHAGEKALSEALAGQGGFDHNGNTLRTLTAIERPYPAWDGLNLTWDTLEGLAKHNGPIAHPEWALAEADAAFPLELTSWASLEAQVAAIADDIAYDNHDIDDGLRAGLLQLDQLFEIPMVAEGWRAVEAKFPGCERRRLISELIRAQIGTMVNDLLGATRPASPKAASRRWPMCARRAGCSPISRTECARPNAGSSASCTPISTTIRARSPRPMRRTPWWPACSRSTAPIHRRCPPNGPGRCPRRSRRAAATSPISSPA
jgi:dGTPase